MKTVSKIPKTSLTTEGLVELAVESLVAHKAQEPVILEVKGLSNIGDYFIICSGGSKRHVQALAQNLQESLAKVGVKPLGVEGLEEGNWVLLDYIDVVVHLFIKSLREFYDLEGLWVEAGRRTVEDFTPSHLQGQPRT